MSHGHSFFLNLIFAGEMTADYAKVEVGRLE